MSPERASFDDLVPDHPRYDGGDTPSGATYLRAPIPLSLAEAQRQGVCRFCVRESSPSGRVSMVLDFGREFAHQECISARGAMHGDASEPETPTPVVGSRVGADRRAPEMPGVMDAADVAAAASIAVALRGREGVKFDFGKLKYCLEPVYSREQLVRVFTVGALKYEEWNWLKGMNWSRVIEAVERHLAEFKKGMVLDPETALRHLAQVAWGCYVLLEYERLGVGTDDRKMPTRAADLRTDIEKMQHFRDSVVPESSDAETQAKAREKILRLDVGLAEMRALLETVEGT